ncbi:MAG: HAMP domain-containing sensor histidine kinase [Dehalococcoidia bacterium]
MASPGSILFSLQTKLVGAFVLVVLTALLVAGGAFVVIRRHDQEEQELNRALAASPSIFAGFNFYQGEGVDEASLANYVHEAAADFDARLLLVDRTTTTTGTQTTTTIVADSADELTDDQLVLPTGGNLNFDQPNPRRPYVSFEVEDGTPGNDHVFIAPITRSREGLRPFDQYALLLAVPKSTIRSAWQGLLPALLIAAAIAIPAAVLLALVMARYISRPLYQLTVASREMAEGNFDVRVSVDRQDEVGRLAQAFSTMARRVGEAHTQMRTLVANVSHDLKTPLTSILGFGQALRDGRAEDSAEVQRMGSVIYAEASRLTTRLNDLLLLSEIESGQTLLAREEIDVRRLLETLAQRIESDTAARSVSVGLDLADDVVVSADGPKLERAFENLIDNARKYTPSGGEIHVRAGLEDGHADVDVANTAPDITPDELPRLFDRFYRRDRTRAGANTANGSGLGLPIARDLIELHGGTLTASLRNGQLVFHAHLPAR